jgi:hypothetical protein
MDRTNFFNGQRVTSNDLNASESYKATQIKKAMASMLMKFEHRYSGSIPADFRQESFYDGQVNKNTYRGVIHGNIPTGRHAGYLDNYLAPLELSSSQIAVREGWAVTDNMDVVGIPDATSWVYLNDNEWHREWILTAGSPMFLTIDYQEASSSIGVTPAGATEYTRYTGDYKLRVSAAYPSGSNQVPIATFTSDGSGLIIPGTFVDVREYIRAYTTADSVGLGSASVAFAGQNTVYDHISALGSGVPSSINPHGQTIVDLGYTDSTIGHRMDSHISGILVNKANYSTNSYLGTSVGGGAYITFGQPAGAALIVNGLVITGSILQPLYSNSAPVAGDYWVVVNHSRVASFVTKTVAYDPLFPQYQSSSVLLGLATSVDPVGETIASFTDQRQFYNMGQSIIRGDLVEGVSSGSVALKQYSTLQDNMDRLRFQIGLALTGTGSVWKTTDPAVCVNPLTSGSVSTADLYHRHSMASASVAFEVAGHLGLPHVQNNSGSMIEVSVPAILITQAVGSSFAGAFLHVGTTGTPSGDPVVDRMILTIGVAASFNGNLRSLVANGEYWGLSETSSDGSVTWGAPVIRIFPTHTGRSVTGSLP